MGRRGAIAAGLALVLAALAAAPSEANWLSRLARGAGEAGEVGGRAASHGISALDRAAAHIKALPPEKAGPHAFAVHATQEGHWKFVNSSGEVFTAGTPEELARAIPTLSAGAPEIASGKVKPALYVTESTAFEQRAMLKDLPKAADLSVVVGGEGYALVRKPGGAAGEALYAEVRPNIIVELSERRAFDEAVWQLQRPLNKADVRVLSLTPGGPETLASVPRYDSATRAALVDAIDPARLVAALSSLRRQTVLITGRTENGLLHFQPASGGSRSLVLEDLTAAAERADVNLIILESPAPRQPGGRNWLWQRIEVSGLDEAMKRATFADFLNALGATRGQLAVTAHAEGSGRVVVRTMPSGAAATPSLTSVGGIADWIGDVTAEAAGRVTIHGAHAYMRSQERQSELDNRIVPGIPAWIQGVYLGSLLSGVIGWQVAGAWWRRLWPAENRSEYPGRLGFALARLVRGLAFLLVFLPVAGVPAMLTAMALGFWDVLKMPGRLLRRLTGRRTAA